MKRPRGCLPSLLGWAVIGFIVWQTVGAWWRAHRDQMFAGFADANKRWGR